MELKEKLLDQAFLGSDFFTRSREILRISLPITLQSAAAALMSLTDLLMVNHLGTATIAAVGIISRWQVVFILLTGSIATANAILTAQFFGVKNLQACKAVFFRSLVIGFLFTLLVSILFYIFRHQLIQFSTRDIATAVQANTYLIASLPLFVLTYCVIVLESSIRSSGDSKTPFILSLVAIGANALLSYLFIYGNCGFPSMGILGAALATIAARCIHILLFIYHIRIKRHWLWSSAIYWGHAKEWIAHLKFIVPITLSISLWALGSLVYTLSFSKVSSDAAAIYSLVMCIDGLLFSMFYGISAGAGILIGHELGAGRDGKKIANTSLTLGVALAVLVCFFLFIFKGPIAALLMDPKASAYTQLTELIMIMSVLFWMRALNVIIINGCLRSGGDNHHCFYIDVTSAWLIGIPLLLILQQAFDLPLYVLFAGIFIEELAKLVLACKRYLSGKWIQNLTVCLRS